MKSMRRVRASLFIGGLMLTACACWAFQAGAKLFVEGQLASSDLKSINGKTYVPLADVAAALHMHLVKVPGGIKMTQEGGANQVEGLHGVIGGKEIFTGKIRFWARSITQTDEYIEKYSADHNKVTPRSASETLYVIDCRIKNATNVKQEMILKASRGNNSLTDDQEHAYPGYEMDAHNETGAYGGPALLPGSAGEFAIIFSVPKGTVPKDFIFSLEPAGEKVVDLRISIPK